MNNSKDLGGRPTLLTDELADIIFERVATHGIGLGPICKMYADMPHPDTISLWRARYEWFSDKYLAARKKQAHILFEGALEIADETKDYEYIDPKSGATCIDSGIVAMQRLRMNARTHQAARILPKEYGNESQSEVASTDNLKNVSDKLDKLMAAKQKEY